MSLDEVVVIGVMMVFVLTSIWVLETYFRDDWKEEDEQQR